MTAPVLAVPAKEGKEKTIVATVLGVIFGVLTAGSSFVTPDSNTGHAITAALGLIGLLATTLGVYIVPNSKVQVATVAVKDAVVATAGAVLDVKQLAGWAEDVDVPALPADTYAVDGDDEPAEDVNAHRA